MMIISRESSTWIVGSFGSPASRAKTEIASEQLPGIDVFFTNKAVLFQVSTTIYLRSTVALVVDVFPSGVRVANGMVRVSVSQRFCAGSAIPLIDQPKT